MEHHGSRYDSRFWAGSGKSDSLSGKKFDGSKFDECRRIEAAVRCCAGWRIVRALFICVALLFGESAWAWASTPADSSPTAVLFEFRGAVPETYWEALKSELE